MILAAPVLRGCLPIPKPWKSLLHVSETMDLTPFILLWLVPLYSPFRAEKILKQPRRFPRLLRKSQMR